MPLLEARGLAKQFARVLAVQDLSLQLHAGEVLGIIGESGCGKSTLARLLSGLWAPDAGEIYYDGKSPKTMSRRQRAQWIQLMFQDPGAALHPRRRVGDALLEVLTAVGGLPRSKAQHELATWLPKLDLHEELLARYPHQLSGGQKQRICLLRALLLRPKILVCDEPLTALDRMTQGRVLELLEDLRQQLGFAMIFISHDISTVRAVADRVGVMYAGRWMECGPSAEVLQQPRHPYTHYLLQSLPRLYRDARLGAIPDFKELSAAAPVHGCPLTTRCPFALLSCEKPQPRPSADKFSFSACVRPGILNTQP